MEHSENDERPTLLWSRSDLERFKNAYAAAPGDGDATFKFDGDNFLKSFAKYLIEYLDPLLEK